MSLRELQRRPAPASAAVPPVVHRALGSPGRPLAPEPRRLLESRLGHDFGRVRIHSDALAAESARAVHARAYTVGEDIVFGAGEPAPSTPEGRRLLAHELVHVVQQSGACGTRASAGQAEAEARRAGRQALAAPAGPVASGVPTGTLQREEKTEGEAAIASGFTKKPEEVKNKAGFEAELKVPFVPGLGFGSFFFLDRLTLKTSGEKESETPIPAGGTDLVALQTRVVLDLLRLKVPTLKMPGPFGGLTLGGGITASGTVQGKVGEPGLTGSTGLTASLQAGYTTASILPSSLGSLTIGADVKGSATAEQKLGGEDEGFKPSASVQGTGKVDYKLPTLRSPGRDISISLGSSILFSTKVDPGKVTPKAGAGASAGVSIENYRTVRGEDGPKRVKESEIFLKAKVDGTMTLDTETKKFDVSSRETVVGLTGGFKF